jgi:hypothetical protein
VDGVKERAKQMVVESRGRAWQLRRKVRRERLPRGFGTTIRRGINITTTTSAFINDNSTHIFQHQHKNNLYVIGILIIMDEVSLKPLNQANPRDLHPPLSPNTDVTGAEMVSDQSSFSTNNEAESGSLIIFPPTPIRHFSSTCTVLGGRGNCPSDNIDAASVKRFASDASISIYTVVQVGSIVAANDKDVVNISPLEQSISPHSNRDGLIVSVSDRSTSAFNNKEVSSLDVSASDSPRLSATLHFHRKSHHEKRDHCYSVTPGPFTCTKTRKYKLLHIPNEPLLNTRAESDVNGITDELQKLSLRGLTGSWVYSPARLREVLGQFQHDKAWMTYVKNCEANDPFRGINLNNGTNRETAALLIFLNDVPWAMPCFKGEAEKRMKIRESLNRFSLWAQLESIEWDAEELKEMFDMVFFGSGSSISAWARKPGSWWATRKKLFDGHRGRSFLEEINMQVEKIEDGREKWKRDNKLDLFASGSLKRKASSARFQVDAEGDIRAKRLKLPKAKSEQVMSETWRCRRRIQEKKAGRWTDGTLRMDRMWAEFYWVLSTENPMDEIWPREVFQCNYRLT